MLTLGPIGFGSPILLTALIALPLLWLLLRAVPPAPIRRRFPGVVLLLGLRDDDNETDKTPWWLLALRMAAIGAAIVAFAGPILNPTVKQAGTGPVLVLLDAGWADARDWARRIDRAAAVVDDAGRQGRPVAVVRLTDAPQQISFQTAETVSPRLAALSPQAWLPSDLAGWQAQLPQDNFDTIWFSDGLEKPGQSDLADLLASRGALTVYQSPRPVIALHPAENLDGKVTLSASRLPAQGDLEISVIARGPDPAGIERELARADLAFAGTEARASQALDVPPELRNRITRFEVAGLRSAGAVSLTDDSLKRRKIALIGGRDDREGLQLLSPTHYLRQALAPLADLIEGNLNDILLAAPDVVIMADVARISAADTDALVTWLEKGGLLLRFAGPQLAASDVSRFEEDPLLPVRLREGGRTVGGAMSWGEPKTLAPFAKESPFFGLPVPQDLQITAQVLAQPAPELSDRTLATLTDGTPLVTRKSVGKGQVILVHVTANAEWSNLPLSGLFMQMLERLAVSTRPALPGEAELGGQIWVPEVLLNAYGEPMDAGELPGVKGEDLGAALASGPTEKLPPGLYSGAERRVALNALGTDTTLVAASWPAATVIEGVDAPAEKSLKGAFLSAAFGCLMLDILAALWISGRLSGLGRVAVIVAGLALFADPQVSYSQTSAPNDDFAIQATKGIVLAHILTGDARVDDIAARGLMGLGDVLWMRTAVEPDTPLGVDIEKDELSFFPLLYWPITTSQPLPSQAAYDRLNDYLRSGGMILMDTRDADLGGAVSSPETQRLQEIAAGLSIPPLEIVPQDHVLTRSFYLLQDFPGRYSGSAVWVEASPADAEQIDGMPFRNLNDGVTPVIIGGNDWASAWAVDDDGIPLLPVGRGMAGDQQREMAYRFGVNLIMHVLTGNYKSDQVHVPALLDRLGQ